ncbi:MAG: tRNA (adenosine(37)-N6)-threonylcarbamoyltransferase complex transferase subunit TsaD [Polyangiaceae bacterium]
MALRVLGIETSCDETAAAVVTEHGEILSDVVQSQLDTHAPFGGVVPEHAARDHLRNILPVIQQSLAEAKVGFGDLDGIAVTCRPGLAGALLVGVQVAKTLAWSTGLPLIGVDHLVGHLLAVYLKRPLPEGAPQPIVPEFPFVALLVSGGHTAIYRVDGPLASQMKELGATRDDAAGEAFDKVGKMLGLGYPGGPVIDRMAALGNPRAVSFAIAMHQGLEFSFSGLKTALARHVEQHGRPKTEAEMCDLCASFQHAVVEALVKKTVKAAQMQNVKYVVLGGGVAANRGLRARAKTVCEAEGLTLVVPPVANCTDNGAMIAYAGTVRLRSGERDLLGLTTETRTSLPRRTRKGGGFRNTLFRSRSA